jgi:uncharacterized membrane protein YjfL (UPF0719 family)
MNILILIQALLAFLIGMASLFTIYKVLGAYLKKQFEVTELNLALSIFQTGILLSTANLLSTIVSPAMNALRYLTQDAISVMTIASSGVYIISFLIIGLVSSLLVTWGGVALFFQITKVDEMEELKKDNIPTALITAAFVLGISIVLRDYVGHLCESLVPYPNVLNIR